MVQLLGRLGTSSTEPPTGAMLGLRPWPTSVSDLLSVESKKFVKMNYSSVCYQ